MEAPPTVASFAKPLFLGELHEDLVFPYPVPDDEERGRIRHLVEQAASSGAATTRAPPRRRAGSATTRSASSASAGCMGLYVPTEYGGQGLTQTGYCRVSEEFAQIDGTLSVIAGVHQSIGMKGIVMFGSDEQKARFLPDLATGRKLAALRADRARGRLGRLPPADARDAAGRRLVASSTARSATSATGRRPA